MSTRLAVSIAQLSREIDTLDAGLARKLKITVSSLRVLDQLYQADAQKASELARSVGLPPTSFTPRLDELERAGLIVRRAHPTDRRAIQVFLTPKAENNRKHIIGHMETVQSRLQTVMKSRVNTANTVDELFAPLPDSRPF